MQLLDHVVRDVGIRRRLRLATWNAHSLTNKFAYIVHVLLERHLDVLAITESWHRGADDVPLLRAAPPGYTI